MENKVIVITGPTGVGKTKLAVKLALELDTEIISADSRQVYTGLDIGSDKITEEEMKGVKHHMLSIVSPKQVFTARDYEKKSVPIAISLLKNGKSPIVVGGTGFYINTLINKNVITDVEPIPKLRNKLLEMNINELQEELKNKNIEAFEKVDTNNPQKIIRALELIERLGKLPEQSVSPRFETIKVGLTFPKKFLHGKIEKRLKKDWKSTVSEVNSLLEKISITRLKELGLQYKYASLYVNGEMDEETAFKTLLQELKKYSKKQYTWFSKDPDIKWFSTLETDSIVEYIKDRLEK